MIFRSDLTLVNPCGLGPLLARHVTEPGYGVCFVPKTILRKKCFFPLQRWEQGHNPELHVNGETHDLNGLDDDGIHRLLNQVGFEEL